MKLVLESEKSKEEVLFRKRFEGCEKLERASTDYRGSSVKEVMA
jgi:hypothetical protein